MIGVKTETKQRSLLQQIFPELTEIEIESIEKAAQSETYLTGETICHQGESGDTFFILMSGQAEIFFKPDEGSQVLVRRIEAPSCFGEMALIGQVYRSATVKAGTKCQTLEISREKFLDFVESNRLFLMALSNRITDHLHNNDQMIIAELRRKNEALLAAYENLAEQEQLRTEFITTLSHELRTPLTAVQGFLHLINEGAAQGNSLDIAMDSVNRNVDKMVRLTNNLLILYEMQLTEPTMVPINIADLLIDAMQEARAIQGDYVTPIALTMYPGATRFQGDRPSLSLGLRSLIENALKFSPDYTPVSITVSKPLIDEICIEIQDQGIGMPEEMVAQIFDPFFRGESCDDEGHIFAGLGIGLAVTRFIVKQHGGRIEVESEAGRGSTFRLYLPHNGLRNDVKQKQVAGNNRANTKNFRAGVFSAV